MVATHSFIYSFIQQTCVHFLMCIAHCVRGQGYLNDQEAGFWPQGAPTILGDYMAVLKICVTWAIIEVWAKEGKS